MSINKKRRKDFVTNPNNVNKSNRRVTTTNNKSIPYPNKKTMFERRKRATKRDMYMFRLGKGTIVSGGDKINPSPPTVPCGPGLSPCNWYWTGDEPGMGYLTHNCCDIEEAGGVGRSRTHD